MTISNIQVTPLSDQIGVQITGFDLETAAKDEDFAWYVKRLLAEHLVVLMPGQSNLKPATAQSFHSKFGDLIDIKRQGNDALHVGTGDDVNFIKVISNGIGPNGRPLGDGNSSAQIWHSDTTPWEVPCSFISFYCRETSPVKPKTGFLSMIEAYRTLPQATKDGIMKLRAIHHNYSRQIEVKIAREGASLPLEERMMGFTHPLVRRHLPSNQPMLYLPTRRDSIIVGWNEKDSRNLLEELWTHVEGCKAVIAHAMVPDDFLIWDNSATVHNREGWPEEDTRVMWHISAGGEVPTPFASQKGKNVAGMNVEEIKKVAKENVGAMA
ncbi:taurine catabolism dioxygenase TauD/TfdA-like protein (plasmid) [Rhizobium gallicum]|uniref:Taurine catabolism dioxygenase TauD/TfdA-like protein n=1 Tax=Rhizobium gallicum TaxID=56730 RepID=A0A1L5NS40_9HYPH|nr:TauD/TfdA family dioxygenase [Rhizobium gallicum]APO70726.1 taurine catabolism dioxygenase TauD/TfdA-like protein [Rhizobium gallicum]